jgi:hypothetical protein
VNSPGNPTGGLDDLDAAAQWGRAHDVPVFSDECYVEFTWTGRGRTILESGLDGVVAVHSLSKRSNLAGVRVGFYAGDAELVAYLQEIRKHVGMMVPGPAQAAAIAALDDDEHVEIQRDRYRSRLALLASVLSDWSGEPVPMPQGAFYLWIPVDDGWDYTERLARDGERSSARASSTGPTVPGSCASPWYNRTIACNWSPIAWRQLGGERHDGISRHHDKAPRGVRWLSAPVGEGGWWRWARCCSWCSSPRPQRCGSQRATAEPTTSPGSPAPRSAATRRSTSSRPVRSCCTSRPAVYWTTASPEHATRSSLRPRRRRHPPGRAGTA